MPYHYLSLQYSAIQAVVNRHNRLWSMAGMSQLLAWLNEVELKNIVNKFDAEVLVAGGGKFTAKFTDKPKAKNAKLEITKLLASTLPMLEFQVSDIVEAETLVDAKAKGLISQLNEQKARKRGSATTFQPHFQVCAECGEFPAESDLISKEKQNICRICSQAMHRAEITLSEADNRTGPTTLQMIYARYLGDEHVKEQRDKPLAYNFEDLFTGSDDTSRMRMAVWSSDLNNMNQKVQIWFAQPDDQIPKIFEMVKQTIINVIAEALVKTFSTAKNHKFLPFRLIVAGGDDLCLVMPEEYVLSFGENLATAIDSAAGAITKHSEKQQLSIEWLDEKADTKFKGKIGPYSFGAGFVVTSINTPFQRVHEVCEELMKTAKQKSSVEGVRQGNSIDWRVMAENEAVSDRLLAFERPVAVTNASNCIAGKLSFEDYLKLRKRYSGISGSHCFAIMNSLIDLRQRGQENYFERWLRCYDSAEKPKSFSGLLTDTTLRDDDKKLIPARIATLFELSTIKERS